MSSRLPIRIEDAPRLTGPLVRKPAADSEVSCGLRDADGRSQTSHYRSKGVHTVHIDTGNGA